MDSLRSGKYSLIVTDSNKCQANFIFFINDITDLKIDTILAMPVSCWKGSNGSASVSVSKGFPDYTIVWPGLKEGTTVSGLAAGNYTLEVTDSEHCYVSKEFNIGTPDSLWLNINKRSNPLCYGVPDGLLEISAQGGTPAYTYLWNSGRKKDNISDLDTGKYSVVVKDSHQCQKTFYYTLSYQNSIKSKLPESLIICKNNSYPLKPGQFDSYSWKNNGKEVSTDSIYYVSNPGKYALEIIDFRHCKGDDTITITQSNDELKAQFLMASVIRQNDTLLVFEASDPIPDSIAVYCSSSLKEIKSERFYKNFVPLDTGRFELTLISYLHGCQDIISKQVVVLPPGPTDIEQGGFPQSIVKTYKLYPNPNDGNFSVDIELKKNADVLLRLVSLGSGKTEALRKISGGDNYHESFSLPDLTVGTYILNLQVGDEMRNLKIIIL